MSDNPDDIVGHKTFATVNIGFTGTRYGMTVKAHARLRFAVVAVAAVVDKLGDSRISVTGHHGVCKGADVQFHKLCKEMGFRVVGHPPKDHRWFAGEEVLGECDYVNVPKGYLERNYEIVIASSVMFAGPLTTGRQRGGTWTTIKVTRDLEIPLMIFWGDGKVAWERISRTPQWAQMAFERVLL